MSLWGLSQLLFLVTFPLCLVAGDIVGTVRIEHKLTRPRVTAPTSSYHRGAAVELTTENSDPLAAERLRVAIYVDGNIGTQPVSAAIEQKGRKFLPETLIVPVGSTVSFPNLDPIFHNVFSLSKAKSFDLGNYPKNQTRLVSFTKPGIIFVHCHLHPNMSAAIVVSPNAWSTRPDEAGQYVLSGVPAGKHKLIAWHKAAGFIEKTVEVGVSGKVHVDFVIPITDGPALAQR